MSLLLAQSGHGAMSARSPLSGVKRKSDFGAVRSAYDPKLKPSIPHRSALRCSLFLERSTPCAWTYTNNTDEVTREMRLITEAALRGHIGERQPVIAQLFPGQRDTL